MKEVSHTMKLTAATMLAMLLGSYLYSSSASAAEARDISKVNGGIRVSAGERVGNILLTDGSVVEGDIIVEGRRSWFGRFFGFGHKSSKIIIDADSSVRGDTHLYREVNLDIADGAVAGEVIEHF